MTISRRWNLAGVGAALLLVAARPEPLFAQRAQPAQQAQRKSPEAPERMTHRRFWGALSLGNATAALACSVCRDVSDRSLAAGVTAGVRQTPRMYLGVQLDGWYRFSGGRNSRVYSIGPIAQYYPIAKRPFFTRLGVGMAGFLATDEDDDLSSRSVAVQVGVGYDFVITPSYLLTPFASYMRGAGGRLTLNGENSSIPAGVEMLQYGLQVTLR
ncbi:MAG TPA: hypothetical protein VJ717_08825 [Gemmatimonadaceae bacterium]|nr:hypothetical protein [Gemmatimonadaceae bacterium]